VGVIEIIKSNNYIAQINVSRGANCISLRHEGYGAKILREPEYTRLDNPYLYGMPILYPNNRISGGRFSFENREYVFPVNEPNTNCHIHGFLHEMPFELVEKGEDYVICEYIATKERPYCEFPHAFTVRIIYRIGQNGLVCDTEICNESNVNMPNLLGFHTTFNVPFLTDGKSEDICVLAEVKDEVERNMQMYLPTGKILPDDEITHKLCRGTFLPFERTISRQYLKKDEGRVALIDKKRKLFVVYEIDEKFGFRLLYNGNVSEYICIEPQTCMANAPNAPFEREYAGFDYIKPHETKVYHTRIYIKEDI
jgi:aldose 1-epimerase